MNEKIRTILESLKQQKIAVSTIEKELGFSNGLLAKAKSTGGLSDEKFAQLEKYAKLKLNGVHQSPEPVKTKTIPVIMEVKKNGRLSLAPSTETLKKMKEAADKINRDFGEGTVFTLGDTPQKKEVISTGSLTLDNALGIGGFPKGRIIEIFGMESSGKTTVALSVIAQAQKAGGKCVFIDAEQSFDPIYADALGVDIGNLLLSYPDYGEQALETADRCILTGGYSVVVIDSVAALVPKGELEGEMGDSRMGLMARLMSQACRKLIATVNKTNTILIFINQLREKIGVVYGNPFVAPGGNALKFYSSVRLSVSKSGKILDGEEEIGSRIKVKVVKSKVAPPFKTAEFDIIFGMGIDTVGEVIDLAVEKNIIQKAGSWYSYNGDRLGQGKETVRQLLKDNQELLSEIEHQLKQQSS